MVLDGQKYLFSCYFQLNHRHLNSTNPQVFFFNDSTKKKKNKQKSTNFMYISKNSKLPHILIKITIVSYIHLSKVKVVYFPCDHHMKAENWRTRSPWSLTPFADWLIDSSRCSQALACPPLPDRAGNCYSVKSELS